MIMPSKKIWFKHSLLICLLVSWASASAITSDPVPANDFIQACRLLSDSARSNAVDNEGDLHPVMCQAFLHGFFSATDNIVIEENRPSAFTLRVLRTRGRRLNESQWKLLNSDYCIPRKESVMDVADKVALLEPKFADDVSAGAVVEIVLQRHYQCDDE